MRVRIATPPHDGDDWNDVLKARVRLKEMRRLILEAGLHEASGKLSKREWDDPVDGPELLDDLADSVSEYIVLPKGAAEAVALWVLFSHAHDAGRHSPILLITSPTKRCGKTTLIEWLRRVVPKGLPSANLTPAGVFRAVEHYSPTLLVDEADTFMHKDPELRGVLNSGHNRAAAFVIRCVGDEAVPKLFKTWCPKVMAAISRMPPTIEDRSIKVELQRKMASDKIRRLPRDPDAFTELQRKCARWAEDNFDDLRRAKVSVPKELNDRARDNWWLLMAVADLCGPEWADEARRAALRLSAKDDDQTYSVLLLEDLQALFEANGRRHLASTEIIAELTEMEDRPWPELSHGQPITTRKMAKILEDFKVYPKQIRVGPKGTRRVNGYTYEQLARVFERYVPRPPAGTSDNPDKTGRSIG
jgi:uncharacterized protein DUF3631